MKLRAAGPQDAAEMAAVLDRAWRAGYGVIIDPEVTAGTSVAEWQQGFEAPWPAGVRAVAAAGDDGRMLGFIRFGPQPETDDRRHAYISSVYVDPDAAGAGIGAALVGRALDQLTLDGYTSVSLWVFSENPRARRLYERCGFITHGVAIIDPRWQVPQILYERELQPGVQLP